MLHEVGYADTKKDAEESVQAFGKEFSPKPERAVTCPTKDQATILTFFDFPAARLKHMRTTNATESSLATERLRQRATKGAGPRTKGLVRALKLLAMADQRCRKTKAMFNCHLFRTEYDP